ncbi:hypothetical protein IMSAGC006_00843 [Muribaculaceae bacterium]|nr:hypothetical protein IMSAGC006_00843 [Muribaculaceae bacterium]
MVGDEGARRGSAGDGLEDGGLHFHVAVVVEVGAHGVEHFGALDEDVAHAFVDHKVDVATAVAHFGIVERVVDHSVLHFDNGQRAKGFAEHQKALGMHGDLSGAGAEHEAGDSDEVTYIEKFFEYGVVEFLVVARADVIARDVDLNTAVAVLKLDKCGLAHDAAAHDAACDSHLAGFLEGFVEVFLYVVGMCRHDKFGCGIRLNAEIAHLLHGVSAHLFLFAEILVHYLWC